MKCQFDFCGLIKNKLTISAEEYEFAVCRLEKLTDAEPGTKKAEELKLLTGLVAAFKAAHLYQVPVRL